MMHLKRKISNAQSGAPITGQIFSKKVRIPTRDDFTPSFDKSGRSGDSRMISTTTFTKCP